MSVGVCVHACVCICVRCVCYVKEKGEVRNSEIRGEKDNRFVCI